MQQVSGRNIVVQELHDRRVVAVLRSSLQHTEPSTHNSSIDTIGSTQRVGGSISNPNRPLQIHTPRYFRTNIQNPICFRCSNITFPYGKYLLNTHRKNRHTNRVRFLSDNKDMVPQLCLKQCEQEKMCNTLIPWCPRRCVRLRNTVCPGSQASSRSQRTYEKSK